MAKRSGVIAFQGRREGRSAFALVNAAWSKTLKRAGYEVCQYDPAAAPPDILIHHDFETHFSAFAPPAGVPCVAVRTWDFGPLPPAWAAKINREFVQYWAHSRWIAEKAREAGVREELIRVVPHGVDPKVFRPPGPRHPVPTAKSFKFLFVGGVSLRKGCDILLDAWGKAFSADDDVTLILKDHSGDLFYKESTARSRIEALRANPNAPEVVHLDKFLPVRELAALYRAADVAVFPYRAEGFCIPILEAMASGTPAIVPRFGAALDFCDDTTSWPVEVRRIRAPVSRRFKVAMGFEEEISEVDFGEMPVDRLVEALRTAREESLESREARGELGASRAHGSFTWKHATDNVLRLLDQLPR